MVLVSTVIASVLLLTVNLNALHLVVEMNMAVLPARNYLKYVYIQVTTFDFYIKPSSELFTFQSHTKNLYLQV